MRTTFKKSSFVVGSIFMGLVLTVACAQTDQTADIKKTAAVKKMVEPKLGNGVKVDAVTKTPYAGLYEVQVGGDLFYTDEKANFLFVGNVMDLKTHKNITKSRLDSLNSMKISDMPLALALKQVKGNGKREIAVFEDPNCGYCKKLRKELQKVDNIIIYTFMYDILSENSAIKSKNVWCSADPSAAWDELMVNGKEPPTAAASCTTSPHDKIIELASKLRVNGTPAIFFKDGSRVPGFIDAAALEEKLASIK